MQQAGDMHTFMSAAAPFAAAQHGRAATNAGTVANAFAAYATAAALVSQGSPIVPLLIRTALTSDVVLGQAGFAYALALEMIVVVAVVMAAYRLVVRRSDRWLS